MKKNIVLFLSALIALVSCSSEDTLFTEPTNAEPSGAPQSITFKLSATHPEDQVAVTRSVKTSWETGDVIFVFFSGQAAPKYLEMKWDGTAWVNTAKNSLALAESETGTMRAVYLPFDSDADVYTFGDDFGFSKISYSYYLTATLSYTVTGGEVSGDFQMQVPDGYVQFFLDDESADPYDEIELREPNLTPQYIESISADCSTVNTFALAHGAPLYGYLYDKEAKATGEKKGWLFSGVLAAGAQNTSTDYHFTLVKDGWQGDYYSKTFTGKTLKATGNTGRAVKLPALTSWTAITDYKPIDMGTDVNGKRIYWASRNVGATSDFPTADTDDARQATWGDYFAWGETEYYYADGHAYDMYPGTWKAGKTGYNWETYQWSNDAGTSFTKYGAIDGQTILLAADDAANANLHGIWRMPEYEEWWTLKNSSDYDWTWDATNKGCVVTVKGGTAWDDPTIFLPAAGYRSSDLGPGPTHGKYWSSSLSTFEHLAKAVYFDNGDNVLHWNSDNRYYGYTVRPVTE